MLKRNNPRVGGDKGCGWILPRGDDRRTGPQTVTRFAGRRVGAKDKTGNILTKEVSLWT